MRKLSDQIRSEAGAMSKWDTWPTAVHLMQKCADELDKRAAEIRTLKACDTPDQP